MSPSRTNPHSAELLRRTQYVDAPALGLTVASFGAGVPLALQAVQEAMEALR